MSKKKPDDELRLEEEDALLERGAGKPLPKGAYNPYDVDPRRGKPAPETAAARTDLRKLSEWIKLKREIEDLKAEEERAAEAKSSSQRRGGK